MRRSYASSYLLLVVLALFSTAVSVIRREVLFGDCSKGFGAATPQLPEVQGKDFRATGHYGGVVLPNNDYLFVDLFYFKLFNQTSGTVRVVPMVWEDDPTQAPFTDVVAGVGGCRTQILYDRFRDSYYLSCFYSLGKVYGKTATTFVTSDNVNSNCVGNAFNQVSTSYNTRYVQLSMDGKFLYYWTADSMKKLNLETERVEACAAGESFFMFKSFAAFSDEQMYILRTDEIQHRPLGQSGYRLIPLTGGVKVECGPDNSTLYYATETAIYSLDLVTKNSTLIVSGFDKISDFTAYKGVFYINDKRVLKKFDGSSTTVLIQYDSTASELVDYINGFTSMNLGDFKIAVVNESYIATITDSSMRYINFATGKSTVPFADSQFPAYGVKGSTVIGISNGFRDMAAEPNGVVYAYGFCPNNRICSKFIKMTPTSIRGVPGYSVSVIGGTGVPSSVDGPRTSQTLQFDMEATYKMQLKYPNIYFSSPVGIRRFNIQTQVIDTIIPASKTPLDGPLGTATTTFDLSAVALENDDLTFYDNGKFRALDLKSNTVYTLPTPAIIGKMKSMLAFQNTLIGYCPDYSIRDYILVYYNRTIFYAYGCGATATGCEYTIALTANGYKNFMVTRDNQIYVATEYCVFKYIPETPEAPLFRASTTSSTIVLAIDQVPRKWGGLSIDYMEISYKPMLDCNKQAWTTVKVPFSTSYTISGLTSGSAYSICISFKNLVGSSDKNCIITKTM